MGGRADGRMVCVWTVGGRVNGGGMRVGGRVLSGGVGVGVKCVYVCAKLRGSSKSSKCCIAISAQ